MASVVEVFNELLNQNHTSNGRTIGRWPGGVLVASVSAGGAPELVIQIASWDFSSTTPVPAQLRLSGFEIWYQVLRVGHNQSPCMVLKPRSGEANEMFFAIAGHLVGGLAELADEAANPSSIEGIIEVWADAWKKLREVTDRKKILGLLGELLAIDRWLDESSFDFSNWQGPKGGPHDFCGDTFDVEVKVSGSRTGPLKHEISSIHQLETQAGKGLYVLSFRLGLSKSGAFALSELIARISQLPTFTAPGGAEWLDEALRNAGYNADLDVELSRYDIWEECLYEVRDEFPRLTREMIPADTRVFDLTYSVNFGGCQDFVVATEPNQLRMSVSSSI